ncbi:MAG: HAMP domain-containing sensor histidine kinase [Bacteroidales bacterium]|nr:HAMP domain-containing sensor histidine kinase [Bacteroidales bacterium]
MRKNIHLLTYTLFLILVLFNCHELIAQSKQRDNILILSSYNPDTKRISNFLNDFESEIIKYYPKCNIIIEDLGCKEIFEANTWVDRTQNILSNYQDVKLKAILVLGQEAVSSFLSANNKPQNVPTFVNMVSQYGCKLPYKYKSYSEWEFRSFDMIKWAKDQNITGGYFNRYDFDKNLEIIRSLYPQTNTIAFITDNSYGGISLNTRFKNRISELKDFKLIEIDARYVSLQNAIDIIGKLPKNSVLLIGTWRIGPKGEYLMNALNVDILSKNPNIPAFTVSGSGFGDIALGGFYPDYNTRGKELAHQIYSYYNSTDKKNGFFINTGHYHFDLDLIKKAGIPTYKLPKDSIIENNLESQINRYKSIVGIFTVTLIFILTILGALIYILYRNHRLRKALSIREVELTIEKEKAEESDKLKSAFLANMSHEIRTPLNAIVGFSSILCEGSYDEESETEFKNIIVKNSELLLSLINDILDISRMETGKISLVYSNVEINELCNEVFKTAFVNRKPQIEYNYEPGNSHCVIMTDPQRLSQVLINLLSNSAKFTEKGSITLKYEVDEKNDLVEFSVSDTGCGIPLEKQVNVFNRFEKLNEHKQGTGLGLSICKQIASMVGGSIYVDSTYTNGTRFIFKHPIKHK